MCTVLNQTQVTDGIQEGFVRTNYLSSGWHQHLLFPSIPLVLKLQHVSGLPGELVKTRCLYHPQSV